MLCVQHVSSLKILSSIAGLWASIGAVLIQFMQYLKVYIITVGAHYILVSDADIYITIFTEMMVDGCWVWIVSPFPFILSLHVTHFMCLYVLLFACIIQWICLQWTWHRGVNCPSACPVMVAWSNSYACCGVTKGSVDNPMCGVACRSNTFITLLSCFGSPAWLVIFFLYVLFVCISQAVLTQLTPCIVSICNNLFFTVSSRPRDVWSTWNSAHKDYTATLLSWVNASLLSPTLHIAG